MIARALTRARFATEIVPAPAAPIAALLDARPRETAYVWDPPREPLEEPPWSECGLGVAAELITDGEDRIARLRDQACALLASVSRASPASPAGSMSSSSWSSSEADLPSLRLYGGFSFAAGSASAAPWRAFGDARFILPRWRYLRRGERAYLALTTSAAEDHGALLDEREHLLALLARPRAAHAPRGLRLVDDAPPDAWAHLVDGIVAEIDAGRCEKIVAARASHVRSDGPLDARAVFEALAPSALGCTRFAFRFGHATLVGATPERLVARHGRAVRCDALAGTGSDGARLLADDKERREHDTVVRFVERALGPLCERLDVPTVPSLRSLRHLLHLWTPVAGRLRADTHVLDLVRALHPTPAVAGEPRAVALAHLAAHEHLARGWYGAPVGWLDARGDGDFAVALRSGVLDGNEATLFAGAGIVRGSSAEREHRETALKMRALAGALGVLA